MFLNKNSRIKYFQQVRLNSINYKVNRGKCNNHVGSMIKILLRDFQRYFQSNTTFVTRYLMKYKYSILFRKTKFHSKKLYRIYPNIISNYFHRQFSTIVIQLFVVQKFEYYLQKILIQLSIIQNSHPAILRVMIHGRFTSVERTTTLLL